MAEKLPEKMGNGASSWSQTFSEIQDRHDCAFVAIEEAICLEEAEKPHDAIKKYKLGIELIDQALSIQVACPEKPDITWEKACVMIQKIKKTRAEVLMRINSIQSAPGFVQEEEQEQPPSYDEVMSSCSDSEAPRTYRDLAAALQELSIDPNKMREEIIYIHEGVRIYFISVTGEVRSIREPQTLKIYSVEGEEANAPRAILEVGDWIYPLVPGVSPCYRTDYGAFILPDVDEPGSSVGIILPSDADSEVFDLLENILHGIVGKQAESEIGLSRPRRETPEDLSSRISNSLINGAWYLSQGLVKGAEKTGELLNYSTPKLIDHMKPARHATHIPPKVSKGIEIAETATSKAVVVTGFVAEKVGAATMKLGQFLAPHIQKQGTRLLSSGFDMSEQEAADKMKGVLTVAAGAVEGFSTVYRGLETSAGILGSSLKDNTVKVVQHKYGAQAGHLAGDTLRTVGNVYSISRNSKIITPKGLVKRTGKDVGKALVGASTSTTSVHHTLNGATVTPVTHHRETPHLDTHRQDVTNHQSGDTQRNPNDLSPTDETKNFTNF